jgi:glucose/arabinose dehydrogenase
MLDARVDSFLYVSDGYPGRIYKLDLDGKVLGYTGTNLPAHYRGGAFIGEHGSWDRTVLNGYKIVYVPFANGRPSGPAEDVVTGFLIDGDKARGRPVALAVDGQGALLIADDTGNSVWRVSAASP